ncbi:MAG: galactose-phosphate uridylyltransferase [Candidatus Parcubacteria bacterium]|jgi:UDPglucose--hexose-1-phosphate uridylyltransferase
MAKYVPDILSRRWVIISSSRASRPDDTGESKKASVCPFCSGNETITAAEVLRYGEGTADKVGWQVRVIPNKYPITDFHEVFIHSPDHAKDIEDFPLNHVELILTAYRERFNFYRKKGQVLIFANHGEHAGASLNHPHSQLVVIPSQINLDTLSREPLNNLVEENAFFNVYCPDFSQWPYEVWITPKVEGGKFGDITDEKITDLAAILQRIIKKLHEIYLKKQIATGPFGYNYYISPKDNWYLRIIPRFVSRAGFELGTGLSVNIIDPLEASYELKGIDAKVAYVLKKLTKDK